MGVSLKRQPWCFFLEMRQEECHTWHVGLILHLHVNLCCLGDVERNSELRMSLVFVKVNIDRESFHVIINRVLQMRPKECQSGSLPWKIIEIWLTATL